MTKALAATLSFAFSFSIAITSSLWAEEEGGRGGFSHPCPSVAWNHFLERPRSTPVTA